MVSPDSETMPNGVVLVVHGASGYTRRLEEMKISPSRFTCIPATVHLTLTTPTELPHNVLIVDTAAYERKLFASGQRGPMQDPAGNPRSQDSTLSLTNMLKSLGADMQWTLQNSGNHAFLTLLGFQLLIDGENTRVPVIRNPNSAGIIKHHSWGPGNVPAITFNPSLPVPIVTPYGVVPAPSPVMFPGLSPDLLMERDNSNPSSRRSSGYYPNGAERQRRLSSGFSPGPPLRARKESNGDLDIAARMGSMRMASA